MKSLKDKINEALVSESHIQGDVKTAEIIAMEESNGHYGWRKGLWMSRDNWWQFEDILRKSKLEEKYEDFESARTYWDLVQWNDEVEYVGIIIGEMTGEGPYCEVDRINSWDEVLESSVKYGDYAGAKFYCYEDTDQLGERTFKEFLNIPRY